MRVDALTSELARSARSAGEAAWDASDCFIISIEGVIASANLTPTTHTFPLLEEVWARLFRTRG